MCLCREEEFLGPENGLDASRWMFDSLWLSISLGCNAVVNKEVEVGERVEEDKKSEGKVVKIAGPASPSFSAEACSSELFASEHEPNEDSQWR